MAYTGKKPTDFVDVTQTKDFTVTEDLTVGGAFTSQGIDDNASGTAVTIDSSGQVKVGTTGPTWDTTFSSFVTKGGFVASQGTSYNYIGGQTYYNGGFKRLNANAAELYEQSFGNHIFYSAASGAADSAITWNERLRILSSGGITFNGDTSTANALDDYEEGTFNPFSGIGSVFTGESIPNARYRKIGKLVHVDCRVAWTATDNSSNPFALTLPFNSAVVSGSYAGAAAHTGAVFYSGTAVQSGNAVSAHMSGGSNSVGFYSTAGGNFSSVRRNEVNGTYDWLFSITYPTDS